MVFFRHYSKAFVNYRFSNVSCYSIQLRSQQFAENNVFLLAEPCFPSHLLNGLCKSQVSSLLMMSEGCFLARCKTTRLEFINRLHSKHSFMIRLSSSCNIVC